MKVMTVSTRRMHDDAAVARTTCPAVCGESTIADFGGMPHRSNGDCYDYYYDDSDCHVPPPPRDDLDEEDDDQGDAVGKDWDQRQLHRGHSVTSKTIAEFDANDIDDSIIFGEDTMAVLDEAESRLKRAVPPPPPPSHHHHNQRRRRGVVASSYPTAPSLYSSPLSASSLGGHDDHGNYDDDDEGLYFFKIGNDGRKSPGATGRKDANMTTSINASYLDDDDKDDVGGGGDDFSAAETSLLRGPIMAARSAAIASGIGDVIVVAGNEVPKEHEEELEKKANVKVDLNGFLAAESTVVVGDRGGGGGATSLHNHHSRRFSDDTPSKVRNGFASPPTAPKSSEGRRDVRSTDEETPYTARERFLTSPRLQQHLLHPSLFEQQRREERQQHNYISPSTARRDFVTSPQDSVSTIGALSPSEGYHRDDIVVDANCVVGRGGGGGSDDAGRTRVIFNVPDQVMPFGTGNICSDACDRASTLIKTHAGGGNMTNNYSHTPASKVNSYDGGDGRARDAVSSLEGRIALGEEQMWRKNLSALAAGAPSFTAGGASSNHDSDEPKKKPFLRKGTRKEPSALHTMTITSSKNNNSINNISSSSRGNSDSVTPSTARQSSPSSISAANPHRTTIGMPDSVAQASVNESLSERLARLARLEKMQEDIIKDLERRQARKEEAQKERRQMMTARNSRKAVTIVPANTPAAAVATRAISALAATTGTRNIVVAPSHEKSRSSAAAPSGEGSVGHKNSRTFVTADAIQGGASQTVIASEARAERQEQDQDKEQHKTPLHVRAEQQPKTSVVKDTPVIGNKETSPTQQQDDEIITPSQARRNNTVSPTLKKKNTSPSLDHIVDSYLSEWHSDDTEGKEVFLGDEKENVAIKGNLVVAKKRLKPTLFVEKAKSKATPRPRSSTGTARVKGEQSNTTAKMRSDGRISSWVNDDERKAFEEWKKKEEEQWALIKNMRKRQEVALREAEGERERAKAWAAAEKEAVQKWATEQRALVKKDRHKAANAALVACKAANKVRRQEDAENVQDHKAMQSELKELQLHVKMMKEGENAELKKLKEVILRQEATINALKRAKGDGNGGDGGATQYPIRESKNSYVSQAETAVRIREPHNDTSKQDTLPPRSKSKAISSNVQGTSKKMQGGEAVKFPVPVDEIQFGSTEEVEEPTEHWLQRHLSKLTDADNNLGSKMADRRQKNDSNYVQSEHNINAKNDDLNPQCEQQRKPYNAANYSGKNHDGQMKHHPNPAVPLFVTSAFPCQSHDTSKPSSEGGLGTQSSKSRITAYNNGTRKEVSPDGTTTISFANGDRKRTYSNEKKGVIVYYYASTKTTQVTHQDGMQTYHFPNKQVENHHTDGSKEITFPNGTTRILHTDGSTDTTFPDGIRVVENSDGCQRIIQAR